MRASGSNLERLSFWHAGSGGNTIDVISMAGPAPGTRETRDLLPQTFLQNLTSTTRCAAVVFLVRAMRTEVRALSALHLSDELRKQSSQGVEKVKEHAASTGGCRDLYDTFPRPVFLVSGTNTPQPNALWLLLALPFCLRRRG